MTTMRYTEEQKALIGGVISVQVLGRHLSDSLRQLLSEVYAHLQANQLTDRDLRVIESALELVTPRQCSDGTMEEYRDLIGTLMVTRRMIYHAVT